MGKKLLEGKVVVFTGKLTMTRNEATAMAQRSGAIVTSTVTNATNVIVTGEATGSKLDKAVAKGIEVWSEDEFIRRMTVEDHQERLGENKGRVIAATGDNKYQFSLAWDAFVDLDISLKAPGGLLFYANRKLANAELDVDRIPGYPGFGTSVPQDNVAKKEWTLRPVENIVCDKAVPGKYSCVVKYFSNMHQIKGAVPFTVHYRVGKDESIFRGSLNKTGDEVVVYTFTVDASGKIQSGAEGAAKKAAAPKAAAPKTAKKARAPAAKKAAPKKAPAKKAAPKKAPAKKAAKKAPAKKAAAKRAPGKKK